MVDPSKGFVLSNFNYCDADKSKKSAEEFMHYLDSRILNSLQVIQAQFPEYDTADALAKGKNCS